MQDFHDFTLCINAIVSTWDGLYHLGTQTLDTAVLVKMTRTLAILPITFVLAIWRSKQAQKQGKQSSSVSLAKSFPFFIVYFLLASVCTTLLVHFGVSASLFIPLKTLSKFCIVMAMAGIGLGSNLPRLIQTGGKPLLLGACCWIGITITSLILQHLLGIW